MNEDLMKVLLKKATGYLYDETAEEYSLEPDGREVLTKRKVTTKYCPPDSAALKTYLEMSMSDEVEKLTDAELKKEKERLLSLLKEDAVTEKNGESVDKENET